MPLQQGSARVRQRTVLLVGIAVLLAALVLAVVLASLLTHGRHEVSPQMLKWKDKGTTKNLQEVILGRCYNYITAQHPELGPWILCCMGSVEHLIKDKSRNRELQKHGQSYELGKLCPGLCQDCCCHYFHGNFIILDETLCREIHDHIFGLLYLRGQDKDCPKIWESLKDAFIYKNPCNITPEDYQPLMELASHPVPCNKSLFWSKTGDLAHRYTKSNQNFLTLEDTLLGYMADKISWCGDPSAPGINYESCPKRSECESNPGSVFWKMASKMFAEAACGVVQVMLNGSVEAGAFRSSSIFGSVEVFNLDPDKVSEVHIWLMQDIGGPQSESCSGHSIQRLTSILEERNFKIICEDNYRPVQLLQCVHNPDHTDCRLCTNSTAIP